MRKYLLPVALTIVTAGVTILVGLRTLPGFAASQPKQISVDVDAGKLCLPQALKEGDVILSAAPGKPFPTYDGHVPWRVPFRPDDKAGPETSDPE